LDTPRVLVVDDEELFRAPLVVGLSERGFDVDAVESGHTALTRLAQEPFDVILLDQRMPRMTGLDVLKAVRDLPAPPEVIFLSAVDEVKTAVEAMKLGAFDYVQKPCNFDELEALLRSAGEKRRLRGEVSLLRDVVSRRSPPPLTCNSPEMKELMRVIQKCARSNSTVLIQGETGTGKELVAHEIYAQSHRKRKTFIPVNCGALQEHLLESELFGHEKGAFTGASVTRPGLFEVAEGGTIFLDEIGEMHPNTQVKLLRVLQSGEVRRVGGNRVTHVDVRVVASTNKDLPKETEQGKFREDLFYRLSVLAIRVPPLRERKSEIPYLLDYFLKQACSRLKTEPKEVSDGALNALMKHDWPGNVRELENMVEVAVVLSEGPGIGVSDLPPELLIPGRAAGRAGAPRSLEQVETEHLLRMLKMNEGNKRKTARDLGIDTKTLYNKLKKLKAASE